MHRYFEKEILISISIIFGSILLLGLAIVFLARDAISWSNKVVEGRNSIAEKAATLEALADLKRTAPSAAGYRLAMDAYLVTRDQLIDFQKWLDGVARGRDISLSSSFRGDSSEPTEDSPGNIGFNINVSGEMDRIIGFLKDIESESPRFLLVLDNFGLKSGDSSTEFSAGGRVFFK